MILADDMAIVTNDDIVSCSRETAVRANLLYCLRALIPNRLLEVVNTCDAFRRRGPHHSKKDDYLIRQQKHRRIVEKTLSGGHACTP